MEIPKSVVEVIKHIAVKDLLTRKGYEVWSTSPDNTVYKTLEIMAEKNIGALVVLDKGRLAGIVSERDYARKVVLEGRTSVNTPVREIMTKDVITVGPEQSIVECMALMTEERIRHLPVVESDQVIGLISIGDVAKDIIEEQESYIQQLESYISGG